MAGPLERLGVGAVVKTLSCATDVGDVARAMVGGNAARAMAGGNAMSDKPTAPIAATATRAAAVNAMRGGRGGSITLLPDRRSHTGDGRRRLLARGGRAFLARGNVLHSSIVVVIVFAE